MPELLSISNYADCHGCSLCILPCPMWQQHRDVMFSPQGIAKAMQSGANAQDVSEQLSSCILCGACDVMCPENIDLTAMIGQGWHTLALPKPDVSEDVGLTPFMMSCDASVQAQIGSNDLYIIDAAPFHADYANRITHYDNLRKQTGCSINLDLNRMAIATGVGSTAEKIGLFDVDKQIERLLQTMIFERVVVERSMDKRKLLLATGKPVVSISELFHSDIGVP